MHDSTALGRIYAFGGVRSVGTDDDVPGAAEAQAYPNPFRDRLTLTWPAAPGAAATVEVFDLLGRRVYRDRTPPGTTTATLRGAWLGRLGAGVYVVRVQTPDRATVVRVTKGR